MAQGRHVAESKRARASAWQPLLQYAAQLPGQIMADRQGEREAQERGFDRQQQRDVRTQQLASGERAETAAQATADQKRQMNDILATPGVVGDDGRFDVQSAQRMAAEKGYRDILDDVLTFGQEWNEGVDKGLLTKEQIASAKRANQPKPPEDFTLSPGQQRFDQQGQPIASVPEKSPGMREVVVKGPGGRPIKKLVSEAELMQGVEQYQEPRAAASDNEPLQTIIGPDGKPVLVRRRDAIGKTPASGTSKPASGLEKRALNFFNRAEQADKDLEALEPSIQAMGLAGQARMATMPNIAQSQEGQSYIAAQRAFTEARLRKDSGAAIPPHEYDNDRKTYFAQPGDSKKTLEDKRRGRAAILASLAFESGQALGEFIGDADEARSVVDGYKARSAKPADGKKKIGRFVVEEEP